MNPVDRLDRLSEKVTQTFDPDFIFLIRPEKIQHFPARNWSRDEKLAEIKKRLDHSLMTMQWQGHEVIYSPELVTFALLPKNN